MAKNTNIASRMLESPEAYATFQQMAAGTNINSITLLATDYLNHFNEIIMLIEMIPDLPECIEDVAAWAPKSYQDHFRGSGFSDRELAVAAYDHVPAHYRVPFEQIIEKLDALLLGLSARLAAAGRSGNQQEMLAVTYHSPELRKLVEQAGAIINCEAHGHDQADIDAVLDLDQTGSA